MHYAYCAREQYLMNLCVYELRTTRSTRNKVSHTIIPALFMPRAPLSCLPVRCLISALAIFVRTVSVYDLLLSSLWTLYFLCKSCAVHTSIVHFSLSRHQIMVRCGGKCQRFSTALLIDVGVKANSSSQSDRVSIGMRMFFFYFGL